MSPVFPFLVVDKTGIPKYYGKVCLLNPHFPSIALLQFNVISDQKYGCLL